MSARVVDTVPSVRAGGLTLWSLSIVSRPALVCGSADPLSLAWTSDGLLCPSPPLVLHARAILLASEGHSFIVFLSPPSGYVLRAPFLYPCTSSLSRVYQSVPSSVWSALFLGVQA